MSAVITPSTINRLRDRIKELQPSILLLTRELVEAESPSGSFPGSIEVAEIIEEAINGIEGIISIERIPVEHYGVHLCIRTRGEGQPILVIGHTDTVHPSGSIEKYPWREEKGKLFGPGIFDMKANCALTLSAIDLCLRSGISHRPIVFLLTCDEESGSATGRALVETESRKASHVLVIEPPAPGGKVKTGRKGTGIFKVKAFGRAAHAGLEPEKGASAILEIARQIEVLNQLGDREKGTTINVGVIEGGTHSNVVPAEASATMDLRFESMEEAERVERSLRSLTPFDDRVRIEIEGGINRPPLRRTEQVVELYRQANNIALMLGKELGEAQVGGASDGNFAAAVGATVLDGLGVEGGDAHGPEEHILIDDIQFRGALLASLLIYL
jgi:glutamate carboxypeptidase